MPASAAKQAEVAERRSRAVAMKARGARYADIARELGVTEVTARQDIHQAFQQRAAELRSTVDEVIAEQVEELEALRALAWRDAITRHPHVTQSGKIAINPDGSIVYDTGPNDRARRTLLAIQERRAKLLGLDAALKINVKADINLSDAFDRRITELNEQIAAEESRGRAQPAGD